MKCTRGPWIALAVAAALVPVAAQESASFKLEESVLNAGGSPAAGVELQSTGFRMTVSSLGEGLVGLQLEGPSFKLGSGFVAPYRPPGEVDGLVFLDETTLAWDPEPSSGSYNLYRDLVSNVLGSGFGVCRQQQLPVASTSDGDPVPAGDGYFYLVTVRNLLGEEGTKGFRSDDTERANAAPCP